MINFFKVLIQKIKLFLFLKNAKNKYSKEDIINYTIELLKKDFKLFEFKCLAEILASMQFSESKKILTFTIDREKIIKKFYGIEDIKILEILSDRQLNKVFTENLINCIGKKFINKIASDVYCFNTFNDNLNYKKSLLSTNNESYINLVICFKKEEE